MASGFYNRLIEAREEAGLPVTQVAIAKELGVFQASVGKWKAGGHAKLEHVIRLADAAGVCVEWLYTGRGPKRPPNHICQQLLELIEDLPESDREEILRFAEFRAKD